MATPYDICFVTAGDKETAADIASGLVQERLAACVSTVPAVESVYRWEGRVEKASETLLIIKTRRTLREDVIQFVKKRHPYATPEIIFTEISGGSKPYLDWLGASTLFTANVPIDRAQADRKEK